MANRTSIFGAFLDRSQFIVIKHKKRTMADDDVLDGIPCNRSRVETGDRAVRGLARRGRATGGGVTRHALNRLMHSSWRFLRLRSGCPAFRNHIVGEDCRRVSSLRVVDVLSRVTDESKDDLVEQVLNTVVACDLNLKLARTFGCRHMTVRGWVSDGLPRLAIFLSNAQYPTRDPVVKNVAGSQPREIPDNTSKSVQEARGVTCRPRRNPPVEFFNVSAWSVCLNWSK